MNRAAAVDVKYRAPVAASMTLEGLVVPAPTFFDDGGAVDRAKNARFTRDLLDIGVTRIFTMGTLGEAAGLGLEDREVLLESVCESSSFSSEVWAGVGAPSTRLAIAYADQAESAGASVLVATPPYFLRPSADGIRDYFRALRAQTKLPLVAYNIPSCVGYALPAELLHELGKAGTIQGVKSTTGSFEDVKAALHGAPEGFAVLPGDDEFALDSHALGATGAVMGTANVLPALAVAFIGALQSKDEAKARELQGLITSLRKVVQAGPFPSSVKFLAHHFRDSVEGYRSPHLPLTETERQTVLAAWAPHDEAFKPYV